MTVGAWLAALAAALLLLYLALRAAIGYLGRLRRERRDAQQLAELHLKTIEALALAIDARDQTSQNHVRRVQLYATALGRAMGMSEHDVMGLRTAALLHDIGKLAVPEHILAKPGPLTAEEFQKVRIHPRVAADIIASVAFPYPVAPLVLNHHERWDGRGYPAGLKGMEIPLGARVLAVADYFDALISDRPYQKALAIDAAADVLRQESGRALQPEAVEAFVVLLPTLAHDAEQNQLHAAWRSFDTKENPTSPAPRPTVFEDIALAHRELYALYQLAQTLGTSLGISDTMALIAPKLANLVPFSACALFLQLDALEELHCRFATGTDAGRFQGLTMRVGDGLNGLVARSRSAVVNGKPSRDLEAGGVESQTALESALVAPLMLGDRFIGTLAVYHSLPGFYRNDHRRLLDLVCEQAAAVVHNSIVFERTQEDSLTDPLTGLPNTRFMFTHLTRELGRAERLKSEVSLLVLDLDDFKEINDTYGHFAGDRALREIARVLRASLRPYDTCVRYAGDEFIVVLSGCGRDEAENKRAELQHAVDCLQFDVSPGGRIPLTVSAGAAVFPHDGKSYETLLAKADDRMYRDKSRRKSARLQVTV